MAPKPADEILVLMKSELAAQRDETRKLFESQATKQDTMLVTIQNAVAQLQVDRANDMKNIEEDRANRPRLAEGHRCDQGRDLQDPFTLFGKQVEVISDRLRHLQHRKATHPLLPTIFEEAWRVELQQPAQRRRVGLVRRSMAGQVRHGQARPSWSGKDR